MRRSARFLVFMGVMCLLLCVGGQLPLGDRAKARGCRCFGADNDAPDLSANDRAGLSVTGKPFVSLWDRGAVRYRALPRQSVAHRVVYGLGGVAESCPTGRHRVPADPEAASDRQDAYSSSPQGNDLLAMIAANPRSLWVIGNEPDRRKWQDDLEPQYTRSRIMTCIIRSRRPIPRRGL